MYNLRVKEKNGRWFPQEKGILFYTNFIDIVGELNCPIGYGYRFDIYFHSKNKALDFLTERFNLSLDEQKKVSIVTN